MDDDYPDYPAPPQEPERVWQRDETAPEPAPKMGFESRAAERSAALGDDLWELHAATARLLEFTAGRTRAEYDESELLQGIVETLLTLAGDSLTRIAALSPETAARIPEAASLPLALAAGTPGARFLFVEQELASLHSSAAAELESWHG